MPRTIDNDTLAILSGLQFDGNAARITGGQLNRQMYLRVNEALETAGGTWNRKAKAHLFEGDAADAIEPLLLTGEYTRAQDFGFFETPPTVTDRLAEAATLTREHTVLEPSAGHGAIAFVVAPMVRTIDCIELRPDGCACILQQRPANMTVSQGDFLTFLATPIYDRVVMNPPFAPPRGADIQHVAHALKFLRSGGRLVSVMSAGVTFRQDRAATEFRDLLMRRNGTVEDLPDGSFRASGTMVNAVIVTMEAA